ncbi:MAG: hypothetical protein DRI01_11065 [Chloroflexi bacterium]|nr:MAG: hypothetical protein DRI01_11065 [Chloroflexota bacterium]
MISLCTLHDNVAKTKRRRIRPYGFKPDGTELTGYLAGHASQVRPLSQCNAPGVYIVSCPLDNESAARNPGLLPMTAKKPFVGHRAGHLVKVALINGLPHVWSRNRWQQMKQGELIDVGGLKLGLGMIPAGSLFDISSFVQLQEDIYNLDPNQARPIFWNQWDELPAEPSRFVDIMMGRTLEMLAPVILSDRHTIYEVTEIAGPTKTMRRLVVNSSEAEIDVKFALGLWNSFKITWGSLEDVHNQRELFKSFAQKYFSLLSE